jgi:hypothetical protein
MEIEKNVKRLRELPSVKLKSKEFIVWKFKDGSFLNGGRRGNYNSLEGW